MNHPITAAYVLLKTGSSEYAFFVHRSNKSALRITRSVTPSLLDSSQQLVLKAPGAFRTEQLTLFAPESAKNYGTLPGSASWGTLAQLRTLWQATDLQVKMPQDSAYWGAACTSQWDPKPIIKIGVLWTAQMSLESKGTIT